MAPTRGRGRGSNAVRGTRRVLPDRNTLEAVLQAQSVSVDH